VRNSLALEFYAREALAGGWSVRQLDRQIGSQFYERAALSKDKTPMLLKGEKPEPEDAASADEEIRNPVVLEFLGLKDEYSESELEEALIRHLEGFLLELGNEFASVGRQKRLRIGHEWFRVDLVFFQKLGVGLLAIIGRVFSRAERPGPKCLDDRWFLGWNASPETAMVRPGGKPV
jgi:predicted nuclease of restriction endonuclease-like (RecB) superfamily